jgi:hypothetical protein
MSFNWQSAFEIQRFPDEFTLLSITIPRLTASPPVWSMSFSTVHDADYDVTIDFLGEQPTGIYLDG